MNRVPQRAAQKSPANIEHYATAGKIRYNLECHGMDRFSFVMVLLSIIVGLGVTELLTNVARQIQHRAKVKPYWLHSLLVIIVFIAFLQQWWEMWGLKTQEIWSFPILLLMIGGPVCLYIISHLMFPDDLDGADFKVGYFEDSRMIYMIAVFSVIMATLCRPVSFGTSLISTDNSSSFILLVAFIILGLSKNKWVHGFIVPMVLVLLLSDILLFTLSIT